MAPLDDAMEDPDPDPQGGTQDKSLGQGCSHDTRTFHRYPDLPFELREPIRAFAIEAATPAWRLYGGWGREDPLSCSRLATVSKEWQDDVEKALFRKICVNPLNVRDFAAFEKYFTEKRKKYLVQFEIAMNDDEHTGFWATTQGLLDISQFMEKTGQLFQQLSGWNIHSNGDKQRSFSISFTSLRVADGGHEERYQSPQIISQSLWDPAELLGVTGHGTPLNVALWAIKSEFPSSLNMVTQLTFNPDCVPIAAAKRIIQVMPNLQSCHFDTHIDCTVKETWRDFTDFIRQLQASAPSLRTLRLTDHGWRVTEDDVPASMVEFANALRELSQGLELLHAWPFELHEAFFLPFSQNADANASGSHCEWPNLKELTLRGFSELPSSGPCRAKLTPSDLMIAASKATLAMPNLTSMEISTTGDSKYVDFDPEYLEIGLAGFDEDEEGKIIRAYAPSISAQAKLDHEDECEDRAPFRLFKWST